MADPVADAKGGDIRNVRQDKEFVASLAQLKQLLTINSEGISNVRNPLFVIPLNRKIWKPVVTF